MMYILLFLYELFLFFSCCSSNCTLTGQMRIFPHLVFHISKCVLPYASYFFYLPALLCFALPHLALPHLAMPCLTSPKNPQNLQLVNSISCFIFCHQTHSNVSSCNLTHIQVSVSSSSFLIFLEESFTFYVQSVCVPFFRKEEDTQRSLIRRLLFGGSCFVSLIFSLNGAFCLSRLQ